MKVSLGHITQSPLSLFGSGWAGEKNRMNTNNPGDDSHASTPPQSTASTVPTFSARIKTEIVIIGAGQAGLSSAYHLKRRGLTSVRDFVVLDQSPYQGGAWQFRWPSLTLSTVNRIHDLPGMRFSEVVDPDATEVEASVAVPEYFAAYEQAFELPVYRPVKVTVVCDRGERFLVETDRGDWWARGIINATGTWETPYIPAYLGADRFKGTQLHTKNYWTAEEFRDKHVIVVGGGISAIQLLDEVSRVTTTTWVTRRPPEFRKGPFTIEDGRAAVAQVEERQRALQNQLEQLTVQVEHQHELAGLVAHVDDFCRRVQAGLENATFEQKRQLVELLIDRVIVTDGDVEIRYIFPTSAESELIRFCHLRSDYFRHPLHIRRLGRAVLSEQGRRYSQVMPAVRGDHAASLPTAGLDAMQAHQSCHPLAVTGMTPRTELSMDTGAAIGRCDSASITLMTSTNCVFANARSLGWRCRQA